MEPQKFRTPSICLRNQLRTDSNLYSAKGSFETLALSDRDDPGAWKEGIVRVPKLSGDELDLAVQ